MMLANVTQKKSRKIERFTYEKFHLE